MDQIKAPSNFRRIIIYVLVLIVVLGAALGIFLSKGSRLPEQAVICGVDVSGMGLAEAQSALKEKIATYTLKVTMDDEVFELSAQDIGLEFLEYRFKSVAASVADTGVADPRHVIAIDSQKLASCIADRMDEQRTAAVLPTVVYDAASGCFRAVAGQPETWYSRELLAESVLEAVESLAAEVSVDKADLYQEQQEPGLQSAAEALAQKANALLEQELEYVFRPRSYTLGSQILDRETIVSFLCFDLEKESIFVDQQAVSAYAESLAPNYTYHKAKDRFVTHDGARIEFQVNFQPQTVDTEAFVTLLSETVVAGESGLFEVPYQGALNYDGTYIEVSIPEQHLWVYQDGVVVLDSPIVTGFEGIGRFSPTGPNMIRGHLRNIELCSDYFVEYWMTITKGGTYGFHDADHWREPTEYGGVTYQTHGSSGCINVPAAKIAIMYEIVEDLTPVMIYNTIHFDSYSYNQ